MKAKRIFFIILICILTASVTFIGGCVGDGNDEEDFVFDNKYNAALYDQAIDFDWFTEEYLADKLLNNCYYGDFSIWDNTVFRDEDGTKIEGNTFPKEIIKTIETHEEFTDAFKEFPDEVDFDKQMLILNFHRNNRLYTTYGECIFSSELKAIEIVDGNLSVSIKCKKMVGGLAGSPPKRECYIVKIDKIECENISIKMS